MTTSLVAEVAAQLARAEREIVVLRGFSGASRNRARAVQQQLIDLEVSSEIAVLALLHRTREPTIPGRLLLVDCSDSGCVRAAELGTLLGADVLTRREHRASASESALLETTLIPGTDLVVVHDVAKTQVTVTTGDATHPTMTVHGVDSDEELQLAPGTRALLLPRADGDLDVHHVDTEHTIRATDLQLAAGMAVTFDASGPRQLAADTRIVSSNTHA